MKIRRIVAGAALGVLLAGTTGVVTAGEEKKMKAAQEEADAMMAQYMKSAQPGEHHAHLARLSGIWDAKATMWETPGAEPQTTTGMLKNTMALGGRFLQNEYEGEFMGQEFEGMGIQGYDNGKKIHTDIWVDSMGTFMYPSSGNCSEGGNVLEMAGKFEDPVSGDTRSMKSITRIVNDDKYILTMYSQDPSGGEFKSLEIVYTRRKGA